MSGRRYVRKLLHIGSFYAVLIPEEIARKLGEYIVLVVEPDGSLQIMPHREERAL